ncbi:hypothetical protein FRC14_004847 [Serendipita sp. 396]|nr:hypothetical protein FRC14_004847 [Serendipita sp. 396]KAG8781835.1 hypothetical protein FRC15_008032 [Serendipita sp. 397]
MKHGHQLESFIGSIPTLINTEKDVWSSTFPNFITFGSQMGMGPCRVVPSSDDSLRHLRLAPDHNSLKTEQIIVEIDTYGFPGLVSVQIRLNDMRQGTSNDLRTQYRERGIGLVEIVDGTMVAVRPPRPKMNYVTKVLPLCILP